MGGRVEVDASLLDSCITAIAVKVLVMDAIRKTVSAVIGCARGDVGGPVGVEELQAPVADHPRRQADGGVAVEDLLNPGGQIELIHLGHGSPGLPPGRRDGPRRALGGDGP